MARWALCAGAGALLLAASWTAVPEARTYENARATGKRCSTCHDSKHPNLANLNAAGRYYLKHRTLDGYTPSAKPATAPRPPASDPGRAVYVDACAACHGEKGEGTTVAGALTGARKYARTEAETIAVIRKGIEGTVMASFADALTDAQIRAVARYVTGLRARAK